MRRNRDEQRRRDASHSHAERGPMSADARGAAVTPEPSDLAARARPSEQHGDEDRGRERGQRTSGGPPRSPGFGLTQSRTGSSQSEREARPADRQRHEQHDEVVEPHDRAQRERRRDGARERASVVVAPREQHASDEQRAADDEGQRLPDRRSRDRAVGPCRRTSSCARPGSPRAVAGGPGSP